MENSYLARVLSEIRLTSSNSSNCTPFTMDAITSASTSEMHPIVNENLLIREQYL